MKKFEIISSMQLAFKDGEVERESERCGNKVLFADQFVIKI